MVPTYEINIIMVFKPPIVASRSLNNDGLQPMLLTELSDWM